VTTYAYDHYWSVPPTLCVGRQVIKDNYVYIKHTGRFGQMFYVLVMYMYLIGHSRPSFDITDFGYNGPFKGPPKVCYNKVLLYEWRAQLQIMPI